MLPPSTLNAPDLFVMLERMFHNRARDCRGCTFSLPYRVFNSPNANWAVIPAHSCSPTCRSILEDLVAELQGTYALS